jgi:hypothetical protein
VSFKRPEPLEITAVATIAIEQAHYLTTQNLWSDALQQLYTLENPSPAILEARATIAADLCE